jgi:hypothetical protein
MAADARLVLLRTKIEQRIAFAEAMTIFKWAGTSRGMFEIRDLTDEGVRADETPLHRLARKPALAIQGRLRHGEEAHGRGGLCLHRGPDRGAGEG